MKSMRNVEAATGPAKKALLFEEEEDSMDEVVPVPRGGYDVLSEEEDSMDDILDDIVPVPRGGILWI
ncbi:MAG: hypothetical protein Q9226_002587 [Calogaya cf. arnoldii]